MNKSSKVKSRGEDDLMWRWSEGRQDVLLDAKSIQVRMSGECKQTT